MKDRQPQTTFSDGNVDSIRPAARSQAENKPLQRCMEAMLSAGPVVLAAQKSSLPWHMGTPVQRAGLAIAL